MHGRITLATYTKLAHVLVSHEPNARGIVDDALAQRGLSRNVVLRLSHFLLVPGVIAGTDYVAALSEAVARPFARTLPLQVLKMPLDVGTGTVRMIWHERTTSSPAHAWFRGPGAAGRRRAQRQRGRFDALAGRSRVEQRALPREAPAIPGQAAVTAHDAVAGNRDGQVVAGTRARDRPRGRRAPRRRPPAAA